MKRVRSTVLVENTARGRNVLGEHGLSFYVRVGDRSILFDTGQGQVIVPNAEALGIDLGGVDTLVLSHGHYDHTGGLPALGEAGALRRVLLHPAALETRYSRRADGTAHRIGIPAASRAVLEYKSIETTWTRSPTEVMDQVLATGEIPRRTDYEDVGGDFFLDEACAEGDLLPDDQALVLETPSGLVVLLGCTHAGVVNTLDHVAAVTGADRLHAVIGGMHLLHAGEERLEATAAALDRYGVEVIAPCHCTGARACANLWRHAPNRWRECAAGMAFDFG